MTLLSVEHISKSFGGLRALDKITFKVKVGEIVGLMGANGAGKTTLFSIIAGHQKPSYGDVLFKGKSLIGKRPDSVCRTGIARTFQIVRPFSHMTVCENVETAILFGGALHSSKTPLTERALAILNEVGMADQAMKPAGTLTLSARKRLEVARALGTGPELLLLDEVMAGLTPFEVNDMLAILRRVKENHNLTVFIIEHVVKALTELSDRIIVLHHGEMIAEGDPHEIASNSTVRAVYFGEDDE